MGTLSDALLQVSSAPRRGTPPESILTASVDMRETEATVELQAPQIAPQGCSEALKAQGLDPDEWEVVGVRSSQWTMPNGELGESKRFSLKRLPAATERPVLDDLLAAIDQYTPSEAQPGPDRGVLEIVAIGDTQFGKEDMTQVPENAEGAVGNFLAAVTTAAVDIQRRWRKRGCPPIAICWLGDHIEGFVSQGGNNAWRTKLTLTEQIRLTRRCMLYTVQTFAPITNDLTVVAVPGNHGEAIRFGKGITRYDDSHDTEALVAVSEACGLSGKFPHVRFLVPDQDNLTVAFQSAGNEVLVAHGHQWGTGKHYNWWQGQSFHHNAGNNASLLLAGHAHHLKIESQGERYFAQVPALESGSEWWRQKTGTNPNPGILNLTMRDGHLEAANPIWSRNG